MKRTLLCALALCLISATAEATTRYVAKTGSDTGNNCATAGTPCLTIGRGISQMAGGDTLTIGDGTYAEQIINMPAGSAGAYTTIKATNDWGVTIDGSGFINNYVDGIRVGYNSYVAIRGFHVVMNQANDRNLGVQVYSSDHIKFQRCSVAYSGTFGNVAAFSMGPADDYVLVEECYVYGGSRYPFLIFQTFHAVVRRCVSRLDYWNSDLQCANFTNYNGDMTIWENNIAINSDTANCLGGHGQFGGFFNENKVPAPEWPYTATRETYRGNIVLDVHPFYASMYDYDISNLHTYSDNVIWDSYGGYYADYVHGDDPVLDITRFTIGDIGGTYDSGDGQGSGGTGMYIGPGVGANIVNTITNSLSLNNPWYGAADYVNGDYNSYWNNTHGNYGGTFHTPTPGAHDRTTNLTAGLLYLPRIETGSTLATAGSGGGQIGAQILYMWGTTGTLWGETGYDTITTTPLWPFPNEAVIKTDMASYVGPGGAGHRGFTLGNSLDGTPQTLTKYIWEYLGNQIPNNIYGTPSNGPVTRWWLLPMLLAALGLGAVSAGVVLHVRRTKQREAVALAVDESLLLEATRDSLEDRFEELLRRENEREQVAAPTPPRRTPV